MNIQEVIDDVRDALGDEEGTGWSERRLLSIISSGQRDICKQAKVLKTEIVMPLLNGQKIYELPKHCIEVSRIENGGNKVIMASRSQLDEGIYEEGQFVTIKDKLPMGELELRPIPNDLADTFIVDTTDLATLASVTLDTVFGVSSQFSSAYLLDSVEGTLSGGLEGAPNLTLPAVYGTLNVYSPLSTIGADTDFGVVVGTNSVESGNLEGIYGFVTSANLYETSGLYGVVTSATPLESALRVYYTYAPDRLVNVVEAIKLPDIWFDALVKYSVAVALSDDNDGANLQRSQLFASYYERELKLAKKLSAGSFNRVQSKNATTYRSLRNGK